MDEYFVIYDIYTFVGFWSFSTKCNINYEQIVIESISMLTWSLICLKSLCNILQYQFCKSRQWVILLWSLLNHLATRAWEEGYDVPCYTFAPSGSTGFKSETLTYFDHLAHFGHLMIHFVSFALKLKENHGHFAWVFICVPSVSASVGRFFVSQAISLRMPSEWPGISRQFWDWPKHIWLGKSTSRSSRRCFQLRSLRWSWEDHLIHRIFVGFD